MGAPDGREKKRMLGYGQLEQDIHQRGDQAG